MADDVRAAVEEFFAAVNSGDVDSVGDMMTEDFVEHEELEGLPPNREGVKQFFTMAHAAFEGFQITPEQVIVEGDTAVVRARMAGTHTGDFMGVPASGNSVDVGMIDIVRFDDGKAAEHWGILDAMSLMQQIGAIPG